MVKRNGSYIFCQENDGEDICLLACNILLCTHRLLGSLRQPFPRFEGIPSLACVRDPKPKAAQSSLSDPKPHVHSHACRTATGRGAYRSSNAVLCLLLSFFCVSICSLFQYRAAYDMIGFKRWHADKEGPRYYYYWKQLTELRHGIYCSCHCF